MQSTHGIIVITIAMIRDSDLPSVTYFATGGIAREKMLQPSATKIEPNKTSFNPSHQYVYNSRKFRDFGKCHCLLWNK